MVDTTFIDKITHRSEFFFSRNLRQKNNCMLVI